MEYFKITDDSKKKTSEIIADMRKKFPVYIYDEENVDKNFPAPDKETTRYFKKTVESDEDLKGLSANDIKEKKIECATIREYMLMMSQYFDETGGYLDVDGWTIFPQSRLPDGSVARGYWSRANRRAWFDWAHADDRGSGGGARAAVSLNPSSSNPSLDDHIRAVKEAGYVVSKIM